MKIKNLEKIAETMVNMAIIHTKEPVDYTKLVTTDSFGDIVCEIENAYRNGFNCVSFYDFKLEVSISIIKGVKGFVILARDDRAQYRKTSVPLFDQNNKVMWKYLDKMERLNTGVTSVTYEVPGEQELRELLVLLMKLINNTKRRKLKKMQIEEMWNLYEFENHIDEPSEEIPVEGYLFEFDKAEFELIKAEYEFIERQLENLLNVLSKFTNN